MDVLEIQCETGREEGESETLALAHANLKPWQAAFVLEFAKHGNVRGACKAAGVSRATAFRWKERDKAFGEAWGHALEDAVDRVEAYGMEIAAEGAKRAIVRDGEIVGHESIHDPRLIEFFLKTRRRAVYGDSLAVNVNGQVTHLHATPERLRELVLLAHPELAGPVVDVTPKE